MKDNFRQTLRAQDRVVDATLGAENPLDRTPVPVRVEAARSVPVYDLETGRWKYALESDDLESQYLSGRVTFGESQPVPVIDQDGNPHTIDGRDVPQALNAGFRLSFGRNRLEELRRRRNPATDGVSGAVAAGLLSFGRAVADPLGLASGAEARAAERVRRVADEELQRGIFVYGETPMAERLAEANPASAVIGEVAGLVSPGSALGAGVSVAGRGASRAIGNAILRSARNTTARQVGAILANAAEREAATGVARIIGGGIEGAAEGVIGGSIDAVRTSIAHDDPLTLEAVVSNGLLGGVLGLGIGSSLSAIGEGLGAVSARRARVRQAAQQDVLQGLREARMMADGIDISPPTLSPREPNTLDSLIRVVSGGNDEHVMNVRRLLGDEGRAYASRADDIIRDRLPVVTAELDDTFKRFSQTVDEFRDSMSQRLSAGVTVRDAAERLADSVETAYASMQEALSVKFRGPGVREAAPAIREAQEVLSSFRNRIFAVDDTGRVMRRRTGDLMLTADTYAESSELIFDYLATREQITRIAARTKNVEAQSFLNGLSDEMTKWMNGVVDDPLRLIDDLSLIQDYNVAAERMKRYMDDANTLPVAQSPDDPVFVAMNQNKLGRIFNNVSTSPNVAAIQQLNDFLAAAYRLADRLDNDAWKQSLKALEADIVDVAKATYSRDLLRRTASNEGMMAASLGNGLASTLGVLTGSIVGGPMGWGLGMAVSAGLRTLQRPLAAAQQAAALRRVVGDYTKRVGNVFDAISARIQGGIKKIEPHRASAVMAFLATADRQERVEAFNAIAEDVSELASNDDLLMERVMAVSDTGSLVGDAIMASSMTALRILAESLPKTRSFLGVAAPSPPPSDTEISEFFQVYRAVTDPVAPLEDLANGRPVNPQAVAAASAVAPALYTRATHHIMQKLSEISKPVAFQTRLALSTVVNVPLDVSFDPPMIMALQDRSSQTRQQAAVVGSRNTTARSVSSVIRNNSLTVTQSVMESRR